MLEKLGVRMTVRVAGVDESHGEMPPEVLVAVLSMRKADAVFASLTSEEQMRSILIACDTVVALDGKILEKPCDREEAAGMLRRLSGRKHIVCSGLTVKSAEKTVQETVSTEVIFRDLTEDEIARYIASGEPMDKAGAYGIQGKASPFIREIRGDFYTVVGMPLCRLTEILRDSFQYDLLSNL